MWSKRWKYLRSWRQLEAPCPSLPWQNLDLKFSVVEHGKGFRIFVTRKGRTVCIKVEWRSQDNLTLNQHSVVRKGTIIFFRYLRTCALKRGTDCLWKKSYALLNQMARNDHEKRCPLRKKEESSSHLKRTAWEASGWVGRFTRLASPKSELCLVGNKKCI